MPKINTRVALVSGATVVASVAMAASASTLAALGGAVGWGERLRWSLPVAVDVLALVAGLVWLAGGVPQAARKLGQLLTLVTVLGSVILNAIGHLVSTGHVTVGPELVIAVSAVPPLAAALAVHLAAATAQGGTCPDPDTAMSDRAETDTVTDITDTPVSPAVSTDQQTDTIDTPAVSDRVAEPAPTWESETRKAVDWVFNGEGPMPTRTVDATNKPLVPEAGGRLTDAELDMVVVVLVGETDPPRSYNELEARFRELGYVAAASRLRAAWKRATEPAV
jgi:hypothetical protein